MSTPLHVPSIPTPQELIFRKLDDRERGRVAHMIRMIEGSFPWPPLDRIEAHGHYAPRIPEFEVTLADLQVEVQGAEADLAFMTFLALCKLSGWRVEYSTGDTSVLFRWKD